MNMNNEESFLNMDFDGVYEPESVATGEYQIRVIDAALKKSTNTGGMYLQLKFDIPSKPKSRDVQHVMMLPTNNDDEKKANSRKLAIRSFLQAFGISTVGGNLPISDMIGAQGWAILTEEETSEYGVQNRVKKFVTGQ
jgi:hypothetical protein